MRLRIVNLDIITSSWELVTVPICIYAREFFQQSNLELWIHPYPVLACKWITGSYWGRFPHLMVKRVLLPLFLAGGLVSHLVWKIDKCLVVFKFNLSSPKVVSFLILLQLRGVGNTIGCPLGELDAGLAFFFLFEFKTSSLKFLIFLTADQRY